MTILGYEIDDAGCASAACRVRRPTGVATNGPCRCLGHIPFKDRVRVEKILAGLDAESAAQEPNK